MDIIQMNIADLVPYENNPRLNDGAVAQVASSISEFGFKVPIVVDGDNVIINGHTRLKAAKRLGLETVPVIVADDLSKEKVKAFRLADNKVAEFAEWDEEALAVELEQLKMDMGQFGFEKLEEEIGELEEEKDPYTTKVQTPAYEPTGVDIPIDELLDSTRTNELITRVQRAGLPKDIEQFLIMASYRHLKFDYRNIAEYYCNAPAEVQDLFEDSALVIIDFDKAIEKGYAKLSNKIQDLVAEGLENGNDDE